MSTKVQLEPEAQAFADATATSPFLYNLGPEKGRVVLDEMQSSPVIKVPVSIEDRIIEGGPRGEISIRILRPENASATLPVILFIHGAGCVFGDNLTHDRLIRELVGGVEAAVVFVNYSRSPEAKYPMALEECYATLKWVAQHGAEHELDSERLVVAGDGVGGNIAAAVTLLAKERGGPPIRLQLLFYPVTNASFDTASYQQFAQGFYLRREGMIWFWDQYTTDPDERNQITASPLRASIAQLKGLPTALIITAEVDVLRDEGEAYANKLRAAGVRVTAVRFQGTIHDFVMLNPLANTAVARGAIALTIAWLQEGFSTP